RGRQAAAAVGEALAALAAHTSVARGDQPSIDVAVQPPSGGEAERGETGVRESLSSEAALRLAPATVEAGGEPATVEEATAGAKAPARRGRATRSRRSSGAKRRTQPKTARATTQKARKSTQPSTPRPKTGRRRTTSSRRRRTRSQPVSPA